MYLVDMRSFLIVSFSQKSGANLMNFLQKSSIGSRQILMDFYQSSPSVAWARSEARMPATPPLDDWVTLTPLWPSVGLPTG